MDLFLVSDKKPYDIIYVMINSFKQSKEEQTDMTFHLVIEDIDAELKQYFSDLQTDTFHLDFIEARQYSSMINPPVKTYLYYVRCLAPYIFPQLDRIIYLDTDTVCINVGIEELWNIDMKNKCIAAATDIQIQYNNVNQRYNTKNDENYWNSGVLVMDLKRMRTEHYDKVLLQYLLKWPEELHCTLYDQTLLNYVFKDNIRTISAKWNNSILAMVKRDQKAYMDYYQTENVIGQMKNAVILHLKGPKPWQQVHSWDLWQLPYRHIEVQVYYEIYHTLAKTEEF